MSDQTVFNLVVSVAAFFGAFILYGIRDKLKDLENENGQLKNELSQIHILVAGQYVKRSELERLTERLFEKLDSIEDKLDGKQDKPR